MQLMNPHSRPVDVVNGRVLAPGEHGDFNSRNDRVARLLKRGTLRRARPQRRPRDRRSPQPAAPPPSPPSRPTPAHPQEVDQ